MSPYDTHHLYVSMSMRIANHASCDFNKRACRYDRSAPSAKARHLVSLAMGLIWAITICRDTLVWRSTTKPKQYLILFQLKWYRTEGNPETSSQWPPRLQHKCTLIVLHTKLEEIIWDYKEKLLFLPSRSQELSAISLSPAQVLPLAVPKCKIAR